MSHAPSVLGTSLTIVLRTFIPIRTPLVLPTIVLERRCVYIHGGPAPSAVLIPSHCVGLRLLPSHSLNDYSTNDYLFTMPNAFLIIRFVFLCAWNINYNNCCLDWQTCWQPFSFTWACLCYASLDGTYTPWVLLAWAVRTHPLFCVVANANYPCSVPSALYLMLLTTCLTMILSTLYVTCYLRVHA